MSACDPPTDDDAPRAGLAPLGWAPPAGESTSRPRRGPRRRLLARAALGALVALIVPAGFAAGLLSRPGAQAGASPPAVAPATAQALLATPVSGAQRADPAWFQRTDAAQVPASWGERFLPLYRLAGRTFGVNWLLIASIHRQETAFSTAPGTYVGRNFVGCCAGPMQFNVANGPITTWERFSGAFRFAARPPGYPHPTAEHPSVYDDFDAIMAAAWMLRGDGAGATLDASAWRAAYAYYGHDATGVLYADQVLARALGWERHGFCLNCPTDTTLVGQLDRRYGAGARAEGAAAPAGPAATTTPRPTPPPSRGKATKRPRRDPQPRPRPRPRAAPPAGHRPARRPAPPPPAPRRPDHRPPAAGPGPTATTPGSSEPGGLPVPAPPQLPLAP